MRKNKKINIIYKDDQIVVCEKPKGIPVSSDKTGDMDLLHQLKNQLFFEENTDGEPQLYLVHQLRPSSWRGNGICKNQEGSCISDRTDQRSYF